MRVWKWVRVVRRRVRRKVRRSPQASAHYRAHKEEARVFVRERLLVLNVHYNFAYKKVAIRDQKRRWGSCSKRGNLNFNYRIMFLPPHLADYIIVHELCHLQEFNHGKNFWALVGEVVPNYKDIKNELRGILIKKGKVVHIKKNVGTHEEMDTDSVD